MPARRAMSTPCCFYGIYVVRLRMPPGYKIPTHHPPTAEYVTVLSGTFHIGMGDKLDQSSGQKLRAEGFAEAPANMHHYAWASSNAVHRRDSCRLTNTLGSCASNDLASSAGIK